MKKIDFFKRRKDQEKDANKESDIKCGTKNRVISTCIAYLLLILAVSVPATMSGYKTTVSSKNNTGVAQLKFQIQSSNINYGSLSDLSTRYIYTVMDFAVSNTDTEVSYLYKLGLNTFTDVTYSDVNAYAYIYAPGDAINSSQYIYVNETTNTPQTGDFSQAVDGSALTLSANNIYYATSTDGENYTWNVISANDSKTGNYYYLPDNGFNIAESKIYYKIMVFLNIDGVNDSTVFVGYKFDYVQKD